MILPDQRHEGEDDQDIDRSLGRLKKRQDTLQWLPHEHEHPQGCGNDILLLHGGSKPSGRRTPGCEQNARNPEYGCDGPVVLRRASIAAVH